MAAAGYSGTPLPKKLGIKPGARLALVGAPAEFAATTLGELPADVATTEAATAGALGRAQVFDVVVCFTKKRSELERAIAGLRSRLDPAGGLWLAWPKRASGVATDVTEDVVRGLALAAGLVDNKVCAIDDTWSGLRCVVRLADRPPKPKKR